MSTLNSKRQWKCLKILTSTYLAWENSRNFARPPLVPCEMMSEEQIQKFHICLVLLQGKFASINQNHHPGLESDTSSVWNFHSHSSDVISQGNQWWHHEMLAVWSQANTSWFLRRIQPYIYLFDMSQTLMLLSSELPE